MWRKRISQQTAAEAIGLSQQSLSKKIRGVQPMSVDELMRLARLLGVEAVELLPTVDEWEQNSKIRLYHSRAASAKRHLSDKRRLSAFRRSPGRRTHRLVTA
jgi:transcriptional regulator with XRE-family HTH domain